jgi:hypothetical protein
MLLIFSWFYLVFVKNKVLFPIKVGKKEEKGVGAGEKGLLQNLSG